VPDPSRPRRAATLPGEPASPLHPPSGCAFHPRCRYAIDRCRIEVPPLLEIDGGRAACHRAAELDLRN
jgi:oligopeptide/dipeptide ABC transporter ATP-binding protein